MKTLRWTLDESSAAGVVLDGRTGRPLAEHSTAIPRGAPPPAPASPTCAEIARAAGEAEENQRLRRELDREQREIAWQMQQGISQGMLHRGYG